MKAWIKMFFLTRLALALWNGTGVAAAESANRSTGAVPETKKEERLAGTFLFRITGYATTAPVSAEPPPQDTQSPQTDINLLKVAYGNGVLVKLETGNSIHTSIDGVNWIKRNSGTPSSLHAIAFGHNIFVAVGNEGVVVTSTDGLVWTTRKSRTDDRLRSVAYGDGLFVCVGYSGTIITSRNALHWTRRRSGTDARLQSIAYGNRIFIVVGWNGTVLTSKPGRTWSKINSGTTSNLDRVVYVPDEMRSNPIQLRHTSQPVTNVAITR